ncbi:MAG: hypothetical protein NT027_00150 [Proteobacteria bacterium]|nr:hypothetical protein [Pseudomonadota bacterium]
MQKKIMSLRIGKFVLAGAFSVGILVPFISACKTVSQNKAEEKAINGLSGSTEQPICIGTSDAEFETFLMGLWPNSSDPSDKGSIIADPGYQSYLKKILPTIPMNLLKWYFGLGGQLTLIVNANQVCSDQGNPSVMIPFSNEKGELAGCLRSVGSSVVNSQFVSVEIPHMYVQIETKNFTPETVYKSASNVVQGFALVASYFASELAKSPTGDSLYFGNSELEEEKQKMAFFLADDIVNAKNLGFIADTPKALSSIAFDQGIFDPKLDRNVRYTKFKDPNNQSKLEYSKFLNLVFAQVLAADMCNDKTRLQINQVSGDFKQVGMQYYNETRKPFMEALGKSTEVVATPTTPSPTPATEAKPAESAASTTVDPASTGTSTAPTTSLGLAESGEVSVPLEEAPSPADGGSLGLEGGRRFPIVAAVISFPFAVGRFLVENRPIRTFFREYQPIRNTARFAANTVGFVAYTGTRVIGGAVNVTNRVVIGSAHVIGRVAGGTINASKRIVHFAAVGTGRLIGATSRVGVGIVTFPFRVLSFGRR